MAIAVGVASVVLGLLALAQAWWFPTGAAIAGGLAVGLGLVARRALDERSTLPGLGLVLGSVAIAGTILVVAVSTV